MLAIMGIFSIANVDLNEIQEDYQKAHNQREFFLKDFFDDRLGERHVHATCKRIGDTIEEISHITHHSLLQKKGNEETSKA